MKGLARHLAVGLIVLLPGAVIAQSAARPSAAAAQEATPSWTSLSASQKAVLSPLERDWASIDGQRKAKWLELATRFPGLPAAEQQRVRERMAEWARMTPAQRTQARLNFQETRQISPADRQAKWEAYQALPDEQRKALAQAARPSAASAKAGHSAKAADDSPKRHLVPAPKPAAVKPVAPVVVQAKPGATTSLMSAVPASSPQHQRPGGPKIAASAGRDVDPATLLPRRGPQRAVAASTGHPSEPVDHP